MYQLIQVRPSLWRGFPKLCRNPNNGTSSESFPGTASLPSRPSSGADMVSNSVAVASSAGRSIRNNLAELQQRFPTSRGRLASYFSGVTVLGTTTGRPTGSAQPYLQAHLHSGQQARGSRRTPYSIYPQSRTNRPRVGKPSKELVTKEVYILDSGADRIPTRGERGIL